MEPHGKASGLSAPTTAKTIRGGESRGWVVKLFTFTTTFTTAYIIEIKHVTQKVVKVVKVSLKVLTRGPHTQQRQGRNIDFVSPLSPPSPHTLHKQILTGGETVVKGW
jgi:hypothetical protein